ncbi:MAG: ATP-binding cassette domain-containing protein [Pseudoruegeria sp.]
MSEKLFNSAGLIFPAIATLFALVISGMLNPYFAFVATSWIIFGILGLSLDVVWGRGGFLSLAQTTFYGLGGYFGSVIAINFASSFGNTLILALPAGALFGALVAAALGYIIFYARMGELQSTILSFTFTLLLWSVTQTFRLDVGEAVIDGNNGLSGIPGFVIGFGSDVSKLKPNGVFVVVVLIAVALYFLTRGLIKSTFGRIVDCVRIDPEKTELLGYDVRRIQVMNFTYAGAIAGIAGALFALWANYLNPFIFSVQEALLISIYVLVGGLGTLSGAFLGALLIGGPSFWLGGGSAGGQTTLILGPVLILLVLFLQNGVLGALSSFWSRFLPDPNDAARNAGAEKIDEVVLDQILEDAAKEAGPAKNLGTNEAVKRFGGVIPVNEVTQDFTPGTPYSLIGPNGAGKSSYLKTCVGLYQPEGGTVLLGDEDVTKAHIFRRVRKGMGVKNQKPQVFGDLSVNDSLWVAAYSRTKNAEKAVDVAVKFLGCSAWMPNLRCKLRRCLMVNSNGSIL